MERKMNFSGAEAIEPAANVYETRKNVSGMSADLDSFIEALPTVQYMPGDISGLSGKTFGGFMKKLWTDMASPNLGGGLNQSQLLKAGMAVCNIASIIARRTGNRSLSIVPEVIQNCIALKSIGDTINNKVRYVWGKKEVIYFAAKPLFPDLFPYEMDYVRSENARYDKILGLSTTEQDALCKFSNSNDPIKFFSSTDKKVHEVTPLGTTVDSFTPNSPKSTTDNRNNAPAPTMELKAEYVNVVPPIFNLKLDDYYITMKGFANGQGKRNSNNRLVIECGDSFECLIVSHDPECEVPTEVSEILSDFINNLFVQFIDTKKYIYTINQANGTMQAYLRPTILPTQYISTSIGTTIKSMENLFAHSLSRGYAFVGYPGTGKTIITKQISNHFDDYCTIMITIGMIRVEDMVKNLLNYVRAIKKCIIILDDLDGGNLRQKETYVNDFINLFDNLNTATKNDGVSYIFLTTVNDPSSINPTIMKRSGRIDEVVTVGYPEPAIVDYLMNYNDTQINGSATTDFKDESFAEIMAEVYDAKLSAADVGNIFNDMTIHPDFKGTYTPELLRASLNKIRLRNEASTENYLN